MEGNKGMAFFCLEEDEGLRSYTIFQAFSPRSVCRFWLLNLFQLCRVCGYTTVRMTQQMQ